jgi:hypothetical protein
MNTTNNDPRLSDGSDSDGTDTLPLIGSDPIPPEISDATVAKFAFTKTASLDLPRLAKTLRSVEARMEQQGADHASLARSFERTLELEEAAVARASALSAELAAARAELESARAAIGAAERAATEKSAAVEALRTRLDESAREAAWHAEEARRLRESVATRDATLAKALESLRERDVELAAMRSEFAKFQTTSKPESSAMPVPADAVPWEGLAALPIDADTATLRERVAELERRLAAQAAEITSLQAASITDQEEKAVLLAHLQASRHGPPAANLVDERNALQLRLERNEAQSARLLERLEAAIERLSVPPVASAGTPRVTADAVAPREAVATSEAVAGNPVAATNPNGRGVAAPLFDDVFAHHAAAAHSDEPGHRAESAEASQPVEVQSVAGHGDGGFHGGAREAAALTPDDSLREESLRRSGEFDAFAAALSPDPGAAAKATGTESHGGFTEARSLAQFLRVDGGASQAYPLRGRMLVGRSPDAELHIDSSTVSRQHAILECDSFGVLIEDTQSTNGTFVNGVKVSRQRLKNGDQVKIGEASFRFLAAKTTLSTH